MLKSVTIYNLLGQIVLTQKVDTDSVSINLSKLASAVYIVKIVSESGENSVRILKTE